MADRQVNGKCKGGRTKHEWVVDPDDRNFKLCIFCGKTVYRTDAEVTRKRKRINE